MCLVADFLCLYLSHVRAPLYKRRGRMMNTTHRKFLLQILIANKMSFDSVKCIARPFCGSRQIPESDVNVRTRSCVTATGDLRSVLVHYRGRDGRLEYVDSEQIHCLKLGCSVCLLLSVQLTGACFPSRQKKNVSQDAALLGRRCEDRARGTRGHLT